jgi:hypothetical protein
LCYIICYIHITSRTTTKVILVLHIMLHTYRITLPGIFTDVCKTSVVDWHHVHAELDLTFRFMSIHIRIQVLSQVFTHVGKSELSRLRRKCNNFLGFEQYIEIFLNFLDLHLVEIYTGGTDPDPPKLW